MVLLLNSFWFILLHLAAWLPCGSYFHTFLPPSLTLELLEHSIFSLACLSLVLEAFLFLFDKLCPHKRTDWTQIEPGNSWCISSPGLNKSLNQLECGDPATSSSSPKPSDLESEFTCYTPDTVPGCLPVQLDIDGDCVCNQSHCFVLTLCSTVGRQSRQNIHCCGKAVTFCSECHLVWSCFSFSSLFCLSLIFVF